MAFFSEQELTNVAGNVTSFVSNVIFFLAGNYAWRHDLNVFQTFPDTKEGEKAARGHCHERVGKTPVH